MNQHIQNKKYICTCGTSIGNGLESQKHMFTNKVLYNHPNDPVADAYEQDLNDKIDTLKDKHKGNPQALAKSLGAEISLLYKLDLSHNDKVVLLVSDSAHGRICSNAIKKNLSLVCGIDNAKDLDITIKLISGLNLNDEKTLIKKGMEQFVSTVISEIEDEFYEVILNPLGGYKAMVSYLTVLGMLYNKKIVYMFEHIEKPMFMPALPFSLDLEAYAKAERAIKDLYNSGEPIPKHKFLEKIEGYNPKNDKDKYEENLYLSFTEVQPDGKLQLSTLSSVVLNLDISTEEINISKQAQKDYDNIDNLNTKNRILTLIETSAKKLLRKRVLREFKGTDLLRIGIPNTSERIAGYFLIDDEFYITNIFTNHDDYERKLSNHKQADYPESSFVKFKKG